MEFLLSQLKIFFTNRLGLLFVFTNVFLVIWGLAEKEWNYSGFHFYYEPIAIKFLTIINLPALFFGGAVYSLFYTRPAMGSSLIEIKDTEMLLIILSSIFQWLSIGYFLNLLLKINKKKIK